MRATLPCTTGKPMAPAPNAGDRSPDTENNEPLKIIPAPVSPHRAGASPESSQLSAEGIRLDTGCLSSVVQPPR